MNAFIITVQEAEIEIRVPIPTEEQLLEVGNASLRKSLREALAQTAQMSAMPVMVKATETAFDGMLMDEGFVRRGDAFYLKPNTTVTTSVASLNGLTGVCDPLTVISTQDGLKSIQAVNVGDALSGDCGYISGRFDISLHHNSTSRLILSPSMLFVGPKPCGLVANQSGARVLNLDVPRRFIGLLTTSGRYVVRADSADYAICDSGYAKAAERGFEPADRAVLMNATTVPSNLPRLEVARDN